MTDEDRERMQLSPDERKEVRGVIDWHKDNAEPLGKLADLIRAAPVIKAVIIFLGIAGGALAYLSDKGLF